MELQNKLDELSAEYQADRDFRKLHHPPTEVFCRYCGLFRRYVARSTLDGHAQCVISTEFKRRLVGEMVKDARLTYTSVAKSLGVTQKTIREWFRAVRGG